MVSLQRLAKNVPLVRGLTHKECPYHAGSVIENRLGLQVWRTLGKYIAWRIRRKYVPAELRDHVNVISRDGVLVIPDFLPEHEFSLVKKEFERARAKLMFGKFREVAGGRLEVARHIIYDDDQDFIHTRKCLLDSPLIQGIISAVIRRPIVSNPRHSIYVYRVDDYSMPDNDVENILHADLHTSTTKAFYYLNNVDKSNGAFVYAKGTHKLSLSRLLHEYDLSIRMAKSRRGDIDIPENLLETRGPNNRNVIAGRYRRAMSVVETSICGRANTLVIANNMGFHRRGEFNGERSRETIQINFRNLEHPF